MERTNKSWRVAVASPLEGGGKMLLVEQWVYPEDARPYPSQQIYIPPKDIMAFSERVARCIGLIETFKHKAKKENLSVREACRKRVPLDGVDAEALEHAITITERERDEALDRAKKAEARVTELEKRHQ